jgi:hypothetical protein
MGNLSRDGLNGKRSKVNEAERCDAAHLLLNIGVIPFSRAAVYKAQLLIIPGIIAFARKIAAENREKMKPQAVVGIDGLWNRRRNGSAHLLDMVDVGSGRMSTPRWLKRQLHQDLATTKEAAMEWKWKH